MGSARPSSVLVELVTSGQLCSYPCPSQVGAGSKRRWGRVGVVAKCPAWLPCGTSRSTSPLAPGVGGHDVCLCHPQVVVQLSEDLLSQAVMMVENSRPTLAINLTGARQYWLEGMLRHEIGQGVVGGWAGMRGGWDMAAGQ